MKKYFCSWEIVNEDREDFEDYASAEFNTLDECRDWFSFRLNHSDYYCIAFNNETGHVALTGWLA